MKFIYCIYIYKAQDQAKLTCGWQWGKGLKELSGMMEMLSICLVGWYTGVYVVSNQTKSLRSVYFFKCKLCLKNVHCRKLC